MRRELFAIAACISIAGPAHAGDGYYSLPPLVLKHRANFAAAVAASQYCHPPGRGGRWDGHKSLVLNTDQVLRDIGREETDLFALLLKDRTLEEYNELVAPKGMESFWSAPGQFLACSVLWKKFGPKEPWERIG